MRIDGIFGMARDGIALLIPHRSGALMIDMIVYDPATPDRIVGHKVVYAGDEWLRGHFPEQPVYPSHCQIECANLVAALLVKLRYPDLQGLPVVRGYTDIEHRKVVTVGDELDIVVRLVKERKRTVFDFTAEITNQRDEVVTKIGTITGFRVP